ncbi:hypothetical protein TRIP_E160218 [uncultured Spirochaetota bacterium]|uniref:Uncharacterized protein n=1 Tax=uncultured Spirochaetota bacterium TaxID=460511 RepID=A0A652ZT96_9SPIR|nr:hypothetical protein TRIP_E160218 [uncultured Spirochaetota bacterium]
MPINEEKISFNYGEIFIQPQKPGVVLWGMRWHLPQLGQGGCFKPGFKWGSPYFAKNREDAITKAIAWFNEKFGPIATARIRSQGKQI